MRRLSVVRMAVFQEAVEVFTEPRAGNHVARREQAVFHADGVMRRSRSGLAALWEEGMLVARRMMADLAAGAGPLPQRRGALPSGGG